MPTAVPTGAHDPPNKIRLVLELYGLFFDELFGHVPERPHSSSQPLDQARDMPPYHRMMVRVVLILLMPGAAGAELHEGQKNSWLWAPHTPRATGQPGGCGRCPGRPRGQRKRKEISKQTSWYPPLPPRVINFANATTPPNCAASVARWRRREPT